MHRAALQMLDVCSGRENISIRVQLETAYAGGTIMDECFLQHHAVIEEASDIFDITELLFTC